MASLRVARLVPVRGAGTPGCGSCYGAQTRAGQCCNTCEEVREAYRVRGWAFANAENIAQCKDEGFTEKLLEQSGEGCQVYGYLLVNKGEKKQVICGRFCFKSCSQDSLPVQHWFGFQRRFSHAVRKRWPEIFTFRRASRSR